MNTYRIKIANKAKTAKPLTDDQYEELSDRVDELENEAGALQDLEEALNNHDDGFSSNKPMQQKVKALLKDVRKALKIADAAFMKEQDKLEIEDERRKRDGYCEKCGHKHS